MPKYPKLHPISIKQLKKGHPWVTKDDYSLALPPDKTILSLGETGYFAGYFLHDPLHPHVKARFLSKEQVHWPSYIDQVLIHALKKRLKISDSYKRDNYYLCFTESDKLPGLMIQKLGSHILLQYHAFIWQRYTEQIIKLLKKFFPQASFWIQTRFPGKTKKAPIAYLPGNNPQPIIKEFGLSYQLRFNFQHDIGLYTDMSAIRQQLISYFQPQKTFLNLYSYTGAFSLLGLKYKMKVTSVDLSKTYMSWLEENLTLNHFSEHQAIVTAVERYLKKSQKSFDLVICDPPSFSSNGRKRTSSFELYQKSWDLLWSKVKKGGHLIVFLNTHKVERKKFRSLILKNISQKGKIIKELYMHQDCPILVNFPEGDYLKGFVIKK